MVRALKALNTMLNKWSKTFGVWIAVEHVTRQNADDCDHTGGDEATPGLVVVAMSMLLLLHGDKVGVGVVVVAASVVTKLPLGPKAEAWGSS